MEFAGLQPGGVAGNKIIFQNSFQKKTVETQFGFLFVLKRPEWMEEKIDILWDFCYRGGLVHILNHRNSIPLYSKHLVVMARMVKRNVGRKTRTEKGKGKAVEEKTAPPSTTVQHLYIFGRGYEPQ